MSTYQFDSQRLKPIITGYLNGGLDFEALPQNLRKHMRLSVQETIPGLWVNDGFNFVEAELTKDALNEFRRNYPHVQLHNLKQNMIFVQKWSLKAKGCDSRKVYTSYQNVTVVLVIESFKPLLHEKPSKLQHINSTNLFLDSEVQIYIRNKRHEYIRDILETHMFLQEKQKGFSFQIPSAKDIVRSSKSYQFSSVQNEGVCSGDEDVTMNDTKMQQEQIKSQNGAILNTLVNDICEQEVFRCQRNEVTRQELQEDNYDFREIRDRLGQSYSTSFLASGQMNRADSSSNIINSLGTGSSSQQTRASMAPDGTDSVYSDKASTTSSSLSGNQSNLADLRRVLIQEIGEDDYNYLFERKSKMLLKTINDDYERQQILQNIEYYSKEQSRLDYRQKVAQQLEEKRKNQEKNKCKQIRVQGYKLGLTADQIKDRIIRFMATFRNQEEEDEDEGAIQTRPRAYSQENIRCDDVSEMLETKSNLSRGFAMSQFNFKKGGNLLKEDETESEREEDVTMCVDSHQSTVVTLAQFQPSMQLFKEYLSWFQAHKVTTKPQLELDIEAFRKADELRKIKEAEKQAIIAKQEHEANMARQRTLSRQQENQRKMEERQKREADTRKRAEEERIARQKRLQEERTAREQRNKSKRRLESEDEMQDEEQTYANDMSKFTNKDVGLSDQEDEEQDQDVQASSYNKRSVRIICDDDSDEDMQVEVVPIYQDIKSEQPLVRQQESQESKKSSISDEQLNLEESPDKLQNSKQSIVQEEVKKLDITQNHPTTLLQDENMTEYEEESEESQDSLEDDKIKSFIASTNLFPSKPQYQSSINSLQQKPSTQVNPKGQEEEQASNLDYILGNKNLNSNQDQQVVQEDAQKYQDHESQQDFQENELNQQDSEDSVVCQDQTYAAQNQAPSDMDEQQEEEQQMYEGSFAQSQVIVEERSNQKENHHIQQQAEICTFNEVPSLKSQDNLFGQQNQSEQILQSASKASCIGSEQLSQLQDMGSFMAQNQIYRELCEEIQDDQNILNGNQGGSMQGKQREESNSQQTIEEEEEEEKQYNQAQAQLVEDEQEIAYEEQNMDNQEIDQDQAYQAYDMNQHVQQYYDPSAYTQSEFVNQCEEEEQEDVNEQQITQQPESQPLSVEQSPQKEQVSSQNNEVPLMPNQDLKAYYYQMFLEEQQRQQELLQQNQMVTQTPQRTVHSGNTDSMIQTSNSQSHLNTLSQTKMLASSQTQSHNLLSSIPSGAGTNAYQDILTESSPEMVVNSSNQFQHPIGFPHHQQSKWAQIHKDKKKKKHSGHKKNLLRKRLTKGFESDVNAPADDEEDSESDGEIVKKRNQKEKMKLMGPYGALMQNSYNSKMNMMAHQPVVSMAQIASQVEIPTQIRPTKMGIPQTMPNPQMYSHHQMMQHMMPQQMMNQQGFMNPMMSQMNQGFPYQYPSAFQNQPQAKMMHPQMVPAQQMLLNPQVRVPQPAPMAQVPQTQVQPTSQTLPVKPQFQNQATRPQVQQQEANNQKQMHTMDKQAFNQHLAQMQVNQQRQTQDPNNLKFQIPVGKQPQEPITPPDVRQKARGFQQTQAQQKAYPGLISGQHPQQINQLRQTAPVPIQMQQAARINPTQIHNQMTQGVPSIPVKIPVAALPQGAQVKKPSMEYSAPLLQTQTQVQPYQAQEFISAGFDQERMQYDFEMQKKMKNAQYLAQINQQNQSKRLKK